MTRKTKALLAGGIAAALVLTGGIATFAVGGFGNDTKPEAAVSSTPGTGKPTSSTRSADTIGKAFLADWVDDDGRVVRRDQGDDTVSEGQAYGMLVAVGVGDRKSFESIWSWTKAHLQQSDGLMAWRWDAGKIVDDEPAADADLDMARALVLAGKTFDDASYTTAGTTLGSVILDTMTAKTPDGLVLLPGKWAAGSGPWSYNPSYAAPATFEAMSAATDDPRWAQLVTGSRAVTTRILGSTALPSDWAQIKTDGSVVPLPGPTGNSGTVQYGYDAGRLAVRYAESCTAADTELAAQLAGPLAGKSPLPMQLDLGGTALNQDQSPLGYVARAAARAADGQLALAKADLVSADELAQSTPTYYGSAWDALGALQLESNAFGACSPLEGH